MTQGALVRTATVHLVLAMLALAPFRAALAADVPPPVVEAEQQRIEAISRAVKSAVAVFEPGGQGGGSGVVITPDGYALSNFHVTSPCGPYMQCGMADGRLYDAVLVGVDPTGDVALIKLLGRDDFPAAEMGDSDQVRVGEWCFAVGNPFLLATDFQPTVTYGIVSGVNRYQYPAGTLLEYTDCIQTDAAINPGNSGGPLFNAQGQLIGINGRGSFEKRGRVNVGVGYAISINQIKNFLGHLRSGRIVDHATLGATVASDEQGRVIVTNILESADAYRRGLRYGSRILAFGGREIRTANGFKNVLGIFPQGWRVPLSFEHKGQRQDVFVRLEGVHAHEELLSKIQQEMPNEQEKPGQPHPGPQNPPEKEDDDKEDQDASESSEQKIPAEVQPLIQLRPGFANFYFNQLERNRVWKNLTEHGDFSAAAGPWRLEGSVNKSGDARVLLDSKKSVGSFPQGPGEIEAATSLSEQLAPAGSGLLLSLHLWRTLLVEGLSGYGDVYYLGTAPLLGREGLYDVLVGTREDIETHFYFDPASGYLVALEMFPSVEVDPCEVYFSDYRESGGRQLPHEMEVRYGDATLMQIRWSQIQCP